MADFLEVLDAGPGWTQVRNSDGEIVTVEGNRNWRNNNPGNIEYGDFARSQGAIGTDGRFAVFPTYEAGRTAKGNLIFSSPSYQDLTLEQAINRYAPPFENNTASYLNQVVNASGIPSSTIMSQIPQSSRGSILDAMQQIEGWKVGTMNGVKAPAPAPTALGYASLPKVGPTGGPALNAINKAIMAPAAPAPAKQGFFGNIMSAASAPLMRAANTAGAVPGAIMRGNPAGTIAGRTAFLDPMVQNIFSNGSPITPEAVMMAERATNQSGDQSVGNQKEAAQVRQTAQNYRENRR